MAKANYKNNKKFIQTEKKLDKFHYRIIVGLAIIAITYYYFIEPRTIGYDNRYTLYIFALPTIIGMLILGYYRRHFLINRFATNRGIMLWTFMTLFYLTQGVIFSYLSFGQVAKMSWDYINYKIAKQGYIETYNCEALEVWTTKKSNYLSFKFNNRRETLNVSNQFIKDYKDENPNNYNVEINVQKGIWNYYLLDNWNMYKK